ncbi:MAG: adenosine deaminase, partial [Acidobacteria bacterium]|nr:adenosine deaminase [Acidobacteriota bacterium]
MPDAPLLPRDDASSPCGVSVNPLDPQIIALPKAELHLHLEGSISPATAVELARHHGVQLTEADVISRYAYSDFLGFLEAFKWVTSFLRTPKDYALITARLADDLIRQNVIYAEFTTAIGMMHLRQQDADANFAAMHEASSAAENRGLTIRWIFDAARQFGVDAAMRAAECTVRCLLSGDIVGFGLGGDELFLPAKDFRAAYDLIGSHGLRRHVHAGEVGGPDSIREAINDLGAERIG